MCSTAFLPSAVPQHRNTARLRPPSLGVSLALRLQVGVLRLGTSRHAMSYTKALFANLCAEIIARAPPNKRSAVWGAATNAVRSGGHVMRSARPATKLPLMKHQPRVGARVPPYFKRSTAIHPACRVNGSRNKMGGRKRAVIPMLAHGDPKQVPWFTIAGKEPRPAAALCHKEQRVLGGQPQRTLTSPPSLKARGVGV
jgi:hypothetical protein